MTSGHGANPIFFNKKIKVWMSKTLSDPPTPMSTSNNISFLPYSQINCENIEENASCNICARTFGTNRDKVWDEGNIEGLLYEGMTIQQRRLRSDKESMTIPQ